MAAKLDKTIEEFKEKICKNFCFLKGECIAEHENDDKWYKACPHWFHYERNIPYSFVHDVLQEQRNNPENGLITWEKPKKTAPQKTTMAKRKKT